MHSQLLWAPSDLNKHQGETISITKKEDERPRLKALQPLNASRSPSRCMKSVQGGQKEG